MLRAAVGLGVGVGVVLGLGTAPFCAAAFASDLVILANGERRSGALTSCDDERCQFDKAPVLLADLLWIGLGVGSDGGEGKQEPPRGVAAPGAVLVEGGTTPGRLVGMSQGTIVLDTAELERSTVRWLRIAPVLPAVDILVRRDGALRTGTLQGCTAGGCTMAGVTATRAELAWVGLGASPETIVVPHLPQDPTRDQAELADGSTRASALVGVNAADVVLGVGTLPRSQVAWIYLAPPAPEGGPPIHRPSPPAPPGQPPGAPGSPPGSPPAPHPPTNRPVPPPAGDPGPPPGAGGCDPRYGMVPGSGVVWTGTARVRQSMQGPGYVHEDTADFDVRLVESCETPVLDMSVTPHRRVGTVISFDAGGTVQRDKRLEHQTGVDGCLCQGEKTHTEAAGPGGSIWQRTGAGNTSAFLGFDLPPGAVYSLQISNSPEIVEAPCQGEYCVGTSSRSLLRFYAGRNPPSSPEEGFDPELRSPAGGILRGRWSRPVGPATYSATWSICRAGVRCPPPPEPESPPEVPDGPPEEFDPCARAGQQASLRDTCHAQLDLLLDGLAPALAEYNSEMKLAEANRAEFERALKFCELYDKAKEVLEAILSGGTGPAAEAARALVYLRDVIEKVQDGDLASMLYPEQMATFLGYYAKAKAIWFEVTASEIDKMQRDLDACSGKAPIDTYMAAKKFLDHFKAAKRVWDSKVAPGLNDLRTKGLECAGLDHAAWRACFADAECRGVPPACGAEPSLEGAYD